jgi:hypothetical protein
MNITSEILQSMFGMGNLRCDEHGNDVDDNYLTSLCPFFPIHVDTELAATAFHNPRVYVTVLAVESCPLIPELNSSEIHLDGDLDEEILYPYMWKLLQVSMMGCVLLSDPDRKREIINTANDYMASKIFVVSVSVNRLNSWAKRNGIVDGLIFHNDTCVNDEDTRIDRDSVFIDPVDTLSEQLFEGL